MSTRIRTAQTAVSALLVLSAGAAAAQTPPLPSLDGVNSISSGTLPNAASGGNGVVRTSGGSSGLPVIVTVDGTTANIQTAANRSVIDWQSFNIGEGHRVNFLLPDRASVAVNRVRGVGADFASRIDGDLWSNGNVWLLNPNGVFFGATARVDVAGLLATPAGLRNLDDLIGVDGTYDTTSTVRFNMPGSSFPTEVTTPGPVSVAAGAEILVRGGPAMFIVGSGVQGRTLTVGGTVTSRSSDLVRGVLTPPGVFDSNGDYGSLPTDSDPAEEISSQVVYAASGDFALTMIERAIDEPSPPNPLSSNDLDLFEFTVERGFAGRQIENDQMAPEAILIEHTAKTVAGQVVVRAAAEASALLRRYDPRDDLGDNLGCDPQLDSCTINRNPDHDTYLYDPQTDSHQFVCAAGPADEACGTINGTETSNGFTYLAYLGVETTQSPDYGCAECAPGIRIRSSLLALDPRTSSRDYGASLSRSLDIDASPFFGFLDNLVITRDANGRPVETVVSADSQAVSVVLDPRDAPSRQFDFGAGGGGLQQVALELVSAGELSLRGRDVCATVDGSCFQQGVIYRSSDLYTAPRVNLRLQSISDRPALITVDRLLRLEETFLAGAQLSVAQESGSSGQGSSGTLRQMVLRNARIDPRAGALDGGFSVDPVRIVVGTAANATNDVTIGSIFGGDSLDVDIDVGGMLRIIDPFVTSLGDPQPGTVSAGNISLKGRGISVGELTLNDFSGDEDIHALTLLSRATDPTKFSFGRISAFAPNSQVSITSAAKLEFDPVEKFNILPDSLRLVSTGGALCVGVTGSGGCSVADLELDGLIELQGQLGVEVGNVTAGRVARLRAAAGSVVAGDVEGTVVDIQAGAKLEPPAGEEPWSEGEGAFTAQVGNVTARDGTVLVLGRDGIVTSSVTQARIDAPTPQVAELELRSKTGSISTRGGTVSSLGGDPAVGGKLKVETAEGALISLAAVTAGDVDVRAGLGSVSIGVRDKDGGFTAGAVTARSGRIALDGRIGVEAGALTATTQVNVGAGSGSVVVGDVSAGGTASAGDSCDGKAVCLGAGFDGVFGSGRTLTTGTVSATAGAVVMSGRDGVTTGGGVLASAGGVEIRSDTGTVDTSAGTVTAGTSAGAHDAKIMGNSLNLGDVAARRDIDLAATGASGSLATGVLSADRNLKVASVAGFDLAAGKIGGTPQSVLLTSAEGSVCLGALVNGACTGQSLNKDTDLTLEGKTGVTAGDLTARRVLVTSAQGALTLADVTVTDGTLALYGRTGVSAGKLTQARTAVPPTAPNIDLLSIAGAITVGDVVGTGLMFGRAADGLTTGAISGVRDIDLRAGKALTTGAISATGFVQLESLTGSMTTLGITAGAAKEGPDSDPCKDKAICLRAGEGATSGTQDIETGSLVATTGDILVRGRSDVTVGGAEATTGAVVLRAFEGTLTAGAVTAGRFIDIESSAGSVTVGALSAGAAQSSAADDPCDGKSVCVQAGAATPDGAQSATVGAVTAAAGEVLLAARNGLTLAGVAAAAGGITATGGSGAVTATGALTAGTGSSADADHDIVVEGAGLALAGVRASGDIALAATGAAGALTTGVLEARRALVVESVAGFGIEAAKIGGAPESIDLSSSAGSVCIGSLAGGVCTGQALIKDSTDIVLSARTGVTAGDLGAKSLQATVSEGTATFGDVTSASGASVAARDGIAAGDVTAATTVSLVASSGTVAVGDVTASDGTMLLQGRTGVTAGTLTQARTGSPLQVPDIDLIADGGSIAVGAVSGTGSLRGRALDDLSVGAVTGVDAVDLSAGKALSASGAITSRGFVELRSDTGSMAVQAVTAGAAKQGGSTDPCAGKAICLRAGEGASSGTQTLSVGKLTASEGDLFVRGRSGVTAGDVRADRGVIDIGAAAGGATLGALRGSGAVTVTARDAVDAGDVVAATTDAGDVVVSSTDGALTVRSVTAGTATVLSSVDLRSKGDLGVTAGGTTRGNIVASGGARLESGAALRVGDVTATQDVRATAQEALSAGAVRSTDRGVRLESLAGAVTAASVAGRGAVDLLATSGRVSVGSDSGSSFIGGAVSSSDAAVTLTARDGVATGDLNATDVTVTATGGDVAVGAVNAAAAATLTAEGSLRAGALMTGAGNLRVRGRSGVTAGDVRAEGGVLDIGAAAGGVTLGAVRGSGAVTVTARDALSAGDVVGATGVAGDVVMSSADGALTVKSVTAGTSTVLSSVDLRSKGDLGVTADGTTRGNIVASGGARLESGAALRVGDVTATQDVRVTAQGALSAGAVRSTDRGVRLESIAGAVTAASVAGRGAVDLLATSGRVSVGSDSGSSFIGGAVSSSDAAVTLTARDGVATGDLNATDVTVTATGGDISLGGATARTLTVNAAAGQAGAGDVRLGGAVTLAPAAGTPAGATPALRVQAARDITVAGAVTSERNVAFSAGRNFANSGAIRVTAGTAADGNGAAGYGGIDIRAADAEIGAPLQARGAGVNLLATGGGGIALGDGITAPSGAMRISDAELQSIDAPTAALRSAVSSTAGRDILVGDIALDRARIGELLLATRQGGKVRVTGTVRGTGAPAMRIGETGMRPDTIEVSGALGTLAAPIGALQLRSAGHILFGPQTFIDAANAAQDILAFDVAAASQGATPGRLFLVSAATSFDTPRAILQQNTGPSLRDGDGIRIGAPAGNITATFATDTPPQRIELFGRVVDAQGNVTSAQQASLVAGLLPGGTASNAVWRLNTCVIGSGAGCAGGDLLPPPSTLLQSPLPLPPVPVPGNGGDDGDPGTAGGGGGSTDDDDDADGPQPVPQLADAGSSAEEQRILPLEVDPGSRDLLRPADDGAVREPGVGSANEDLWPQGALPQ